MVLIPSMSFRKAALAALFLVCPVGAVLGQAQFPAKTAWGNPTASSGLPTAMSQAQITSLCNPFSASLLGCAPASGGGTVNFLRADGGWAAPVGTAGITALTGDVAATGPGSVAATLATVNSNVGTFGSATQCVIHTVNAKGLITAASATACAPPFSSVTGTIASTQMLPGADSGNLVSETSSFTVQTTDCNKTFYFSSTSQATVTVAAGGAFAANCRFWLNNTGVYTGSSSARGLMLNGISGAAFINQGATLYPGQKTEFSNIGASSAWVETGYDWRKRWKPPVAPTWFVDCASGSDSAADGLGTGAGANLTVGQSYNRYSNFVDYSGGAAQAVMTIAGTCGAGDTLHMAGPLVGSTGNAALVINGSGTITAIGGSPCVAGFDGGVVQIAVMNCQGTGGCVSVATGAKGFINGNITCNAGANGFQASDSGSRIEWVSGTISLGNSGGASFNQIIAINNDGQWVSDGGTAFSLLGNITIAGNGTVQAFGLALLDLSSVTWTLNAHAVTGTRYFCDQWAVIRGAGGAPNTFFPGSVNGTTGSACLTP